MASKTTTNSARLEAALDLARRMPPAAAPEVLNSLLTLLLPKGETALAEELVERVEQPLEEALDERAGRSFLLTPYNRDGDSHRSPWSNQYFPPLDERDEGEGEEPPYYPSDALRALELEANELWKVYQELYYGGEAVGSVYLWDLESGGGGATGAGGLAGCFAVKKRIKDGPGGLQDGGWGALHVVEGLPAADGRSATYKLTSSVLLSLAVRGEAAAVGELDVSGSVSRHAEASHPLLSHGAGALPLAQQHLAHMGRLIEDTEIQLRGDLDALYLQRTREVVHALRSGAAQDVGGAGTEGESEREATGQQEQEQHQQQRRPPAGAIRLPGMAAGPPGHQQSLFEAINRRRTQQQQEEDVVEG